MESLWDAFDDVRVLKVDGGEGGGGWQSFLFLSHYIHDAFSVRDAGNLGFPMVGQVFIVSYQHLLDKIFRGDVCANPNHHVREWVEKTEF